MLLSRWHFGYLFNFRPQSIQYEEPYDPIRYKYGPDDTKGVALNESSHLPYKYPYKYQHGRHASPQYFNVPCETCDPYEDNRKKLPRFLLPWPLTLYTPDRQRPFPASTFMLFTPMIILPFIPFGLFEFSLPMGWDANWAVER